jgi:hypothetical protein
MEGIALKRAIYDSIYALDIIFTAPAAYAQWSNMPAAVTEFLGVTCHRTTFNLANADRARIIARVGATAPVANAKLKIQYSIDDANFSDLCSVTMPATANLTNIGVWSTIPPAAKKEVYLRLVGIDGDGAIDPTFGRISLQIRS